MSTRQLIILLTILAVAILFFVLTMHRYTYSIGKLGNTPTAYRIDRLTGRTEFGFRGRPDWICISGCK